MIALFVQIVLFIALIEVAIWSLPREVRRASQVNCLRPNGTRSVTRSRLERRAYRYLRFELIAPLFLIFLLGNACYQSIDKTIVPIATLGSNLSQRIGLATMPDASTDSPSTSVWLRVTAMALAWLVISLAIASWRLRRAYQTFAEGVRTRSSEYAQFDVSRTREKTATPTIPNSSDSGQNNVA